MGPVEKYFPLECGICFEQVRREPNIICQIIKTCTHSFCSDCLPKIEECPLCRKTFTREDIIPNRIVNDYIESQWQQTEKVAQPILQPEAASSSAVVKEKDTNQDYEFVREIYRWKARETMIKALEANRCWFNFYSLWDTFVDKLLNHPHTDTNTKLSINKAEVLDTASSYENATVHLYRKACCQWLKGVKLDSSEEYIKALFEILEGTLTPKEWGIFKTYADKTIFSDVDNQQPVIETLVEILNIPIDQLERAWIDDSRLAVSNTMCRILVEAFFMVKHEAKVELKGIRGLNPVKMIHQVCTGGGLACPTFFDIISYMFENNKYFYCQKLVDHLERQIRRA